jgi:hypothetical protein
MTTDALSPLTAFIQRRADAKRPDDIQPYNADALVHITEDTSTDMHLLSLTLCLLGFNLQSIPMLWMGLFATLMQLAYPNERKGAWFHTVQTYITMS